jgi:transcriptional regulator with XRE-family HTH domain
MSSQLAYNFSVVSNEAEQKRERVSRWGAELRRRRVDAGYRFANAFAKVIGVSPTYYSELEKASKKLITEPGDGILAAVERVIGWPKSEQLAILRSLDEDLVEKIRNAPDDPELIRVMAERVAAYAGRIGQVTSGTQQDAAVRANLGRTVEEQEKAEAEALKRGREGRKR